MYAALLSEAMALDHDPPSLVASLVQMTTDCRKKLIENQRGRQETAAASLSNEVAYDRALIHLCRAIGIETAPNRFGVPSAERERLERRLSQVGLPVNDCWAPFVSPDEPTGGATTS